MIFSTKFSTASGQYCSGDLIFEDTFDIFDTRKWQHENTLAGGGVSIQMFYFAGFLSN